MGTKRQDVVMQEVVRATEQGQGRKQCIRSEVNMHGAEQNRGNIRGNRKKEAGSTLSRWVRGHIEVRDPRMAGNRTIRLIGEQSRIEATLEETGRRRRGVH